MTAKENEGKMRDKPKSIWIAHAVYPNLSLTKKDHDFYLSEMVYGSDVDNYGEYIPRAPLTDNAQALLDALEKIAKGLTQVFDEDLQCNVEAWMNEGEMQEIARAAIAAASAQQTPGEG